MTNLMKTYNITTSLDSGIVAFACTELRYFLERTTPLLETAQSSDADLLIEMVIDTSLEVTCYTYEIQHLTAHQKVSLTGSDESCILHALYDFLAECGFFFDVNGPIAPESVDLTLLVAGKREITPRVKRRGIRQHINFTMDISSYPLAEALEYIRNLARMRMNHISFHSYKGQWYDYQENGEYHFGGNLFYGARHDIPDIPVIADNIRNRETYTIPEIEADIQRPEVRSQRTTEWLNSVMRECKRVGLHVQLSIEPTGQTHREGMTICRNVMQQYPYIDTFELITPECGHSEFIPETKDLLKLVSEFLSDNGFEIPGLDSELENDNYQLIGGMYHAMRNCTLAKELLQTRSSTDDPDLVLGVYITDAKALKILLEFLKESAPDEVSLTFLPAHGARLAVHNLKQMGFTRSLAARTMVYSWIEFDGNMYLQQNSVKGTQQLIEFLQEKMTPCQIYGVALNHWRTAENRTCFAYAAGAFVNGPLQPDVFYRNYAEVMGITDIRGYTSIMNELDELDDMARNNLFNIGFCVNGCWIRPGLKWTRNWKNQSIEVAKQRFRHLVKVIEECLLSATKKIGREYLRFLINRIECSILQLEVARLMKSLSEFCDHSKPDDLTDQEREKVSATCAQAMTIAQKYIEKHAKQIVDRGCEGTLINYYATIPQYIAHIRTVFVEGERVCTHLLPHFDEPPAPEIIE
jgi:hypothetical protein